MGALILIAGANGSGKSRFAEELIGRTAGKRWYIATMVPQTADNYSRIEKHRRQREHLGFFTLEISAAVGDAAVSQRDVVLLEDVSNLLANVMFEHGGDAAAVCRDIFRLASRCRLLAAVTIDGLRPEAYEAETARYAAALSEVNERLFEQASAVVKMSGGIPRWIKGSSRCIT